MRKCPKCETEKDDFEFGKNKNHRHGLDTYCKACRYAGNKAYRLANAEKVSTYRKAYYQEHLEEEKSRLKEYAKGHRRKTTAPEARKRREVRLRKAYDLAPECYAEMLEQQGGVCALCGKTNKDGHALAVDHNHTTGNLRDLLCRKCNMGLGLFNEDIEVLTKTIEYLKKHA